MTNAGSLGWWFVGGRMDLQLEPAGKKLYTRHTHPMTHEAHKWGSQESRPRYSISLAAEDTTTGRTRAAIFGYMHSNSNLD